MRAGSLLPPLAVSWAVALTSTSALAASSTVVANAGGGLDAIEVKLDDGAGKLLVRRCASSNCSDTGGTTRALPIPIERSRLDLAGSTITVLAIGEGRRVVHVRVPDAQRRDLAFEAIVAGNHGGEPIFSGLTGYTQGDDGDRSGKAILIYDRPSQPGDREDRTKFILIADTREDTRICGQATTPLGARGIDPKTLELRGATLHRIEKEARDAAIPIVAQPRPQAARAPLARILVATGGSTPGAPALTDGDPNTAWSERRPGDGHGEFVTMRAPSELPIHGAVVTITPTTTKRDGAAPRTFFLATDQELFHVTMPEDAWLRPGASYEIALPSAVRTTCLALVLDEAFERNLRAPEVTLSELSATTRFDVDGASFDDVAKELATPRAEEAAALLRRSGDEGLAAVVERWASLDDRGRALAIDVASSAGSCDGAAMDLLTRGLTDKVVEVKRRALGRIERCGKSAVPSLSRAVRSDDEATRAGAAPLLAAIAPDAAIEPLGEQLGSGRAETRRAIRGAFARAAKRAPRDKLFSMLSKEGSLETRLDLLRAMGTRLPELRPESGAAIAAVLRSSPDMTTRYLVVIPLAHLARSPDATSGELSRLAAMARQDPDWQVRMHAVEQSAGITALAPIVTAATTDPAPRVRETALRTIALGKLPSGSEPAAKALTSDVWTFVRVAAAEALGAIPENAAGQKALVRALDDASPKVRASVVAALGNLRATEHAPKIRERLDDEAEYVEVRALAARTLGAMCVKGTTDRLTKLALRSLAPVDEADERIGMAAIEALAALHPPDLERRLAPLRGKNVRLPVRRAAERAVSEQGLCR